MAKRATIYLVRHAKAGERRVWKGDDVDRPLSMKGWRQSRAIALRLKKGGVTALYSSDYVRCIQTLEPLGELLGLGVATDLRLTENQPSGPVIEFLSSVDDGAVLCSHGDIIPATIEALRRGGMQLDASPEWGKASVWVLRRNGVRITSGKVWPPPVLAAKQK